VLMRAHDLAHDRHLLPINELMRAFVSSRYERVVDFAIQLRDPDVRVRHQHLAICQDLDDLESSLKNPAL
jgi:hypothetical protein